MPVPKWGQTQAEKYFGLIERGFDQLLENPYIGKAGPDIKHGCSALRIEKRAIFYFIGSEFIDTLGIPRA